MSIDYVHYLNNLRAGFLGLLATTCLMISSAQTYAGDGMLDPSFDPLSSTVFGGTINAIVVQDNGQIIVGGEFTDLGGLSRRNLARLNADGSADPSFDPSPNFTVSDLTLTDDNKILIAGNFTEVNGEPHFKMASLNLDGSTDLLFSSPISDIPNYIESVTSLMPVGSSQFLIGGSLFGQSASTVARIFSTGVVDTGFEASVGFQPFEFARQVNGKVIVGGGGFGSAGLVRIESNGVDIDTDFNPNPNGTRIDSVAIQSDGRIVVAGDFSVIDNAFASRIVRLNADGSLDTAFNPQPNGSVSTILIQDDDSILIGGNFTMLGGATANRIARLNSDGSLDTSFGAPEINSGVSALAIQADNNVLIGGSFFMVDGVSRHRMARLLTNQAPPETESDDGFIVIPLKNKGAVIIPN